MISSGSEDEVRPILEHCSSTDTLDEPEVDRRLSDRFAELLFVNVDNVEIFSCEFENESNLGVSLEIIDKSSPFHLSPHLWLFCYL